MEKPGVNLRCKLPLQSGESDLIENLGVRPAKEPVLSEGIIPDYFFDVIKRRAYQQVDCTHCRRQVKVLIPMKVIADSDRIPVTGSEMKLIVFAATRRWRSYR